MRKTLILILIVLLIIAMGYMMFQSMSIGGMQILGLRALNEENKTLEASIQKASRLSSTEYQEALKSLTETAKNYKNAKSEYDELVTLSTSSEVATANQLQKYEIEYLWTKIGTHATSEDVLLKIEVATNNTSAATGYYDLKFTATGDYVGITDFIYDIENDSSLGFKIEEFKLLPGGGTSENSGGTDTAKLNATFTCKNIAINIDPSFIIKPQSEENSNGQTEGEGTTNSTDNTNTTNTTNSTNTVNTTSGTNTTNTTR